MAKKAPKTSKKKTASRGRKAPKGHPFFHQDNPWLFLLLTMLAIAAVLATGCGGGSTGSTSEAGGVSGSGLGPLVNNDPTIFGGGGGSGTGSIIGDQCPTNPQVLNLSITNVLTLYTNTNTTVPSIYPVIANGNAGNHPNHPIVIYTGPTQDPSDLDRTLVQMEVTIDQVGVSADDSHLEIRVRSLTDPLNVDFGLFLPTSEIFPIPISGGTSLARYFDDQAPGELDSVYPDPYDFNSYSPGSQILSVQVCYATISDGTQPITNVASNPIFVEIRPSAN